MQQPSSGPDGREKASPGERLPNERDESVDSQASEPRRVIEQARRDLESGLTDTDRGTPMDTVYKHTARTSGDPPNRGDEVFVKGAGRPAPSESPRASHERNPMQTARHHHDRGLDKAQGQAEQSHLVGREQAGYGLAGEQAGGDAARSGGSRSQWGSSYGDFKPERGAFGDRQYGGHMGDYYAGGSDHRGARHGGHDEFEADYHRWRQEQVQQLDEDYRVWRRDNPAFSGEFPRWREARLGQQGSGGQPQVPQSESDDDALADSGSQTSLGYGGTGQERETSGSTSGGAADGTSGAAPADDPLRGSPRRGGPASTH